MRLRSLIISKCRLLVSILWEIPVPILSRWVVNPSNGRAGLKDAWTTAKPNQVHAPTCGIYDHEQWAEGPHCRDFFFVCEELADCIEDIFVDTETRASDHQPIVLTLHA